MDDDEVVTHEVFREGWLHVLADRCKSCLFRSVNDGRIMGLTPGRVAGMVLAAREAGGHITCHITIFEEDPKPAICRGYWDLPNRPDLLQLAERMGVVVYDEVPA
jgi:hypothetical protein